MTQQTVWDYLLAIITIGAVAIGLISMAVGQVERWRARYATPRRARLSTAAPRRARPRLPVRVMLRSTPVAARSSTSNAEPRSYAVGQRTEQTGTADRNAVPSLSEHMGTLSDDALLAELALVTNADGTLKYAESRIAKFIGGRVEDRIAQVRVVRGLAITPKAAPINRQFPHRTIEQSLLREQLGIGKKATP